MQSLQIGLVAILIFCAPRVMALTFVPEPTIQDVHTTVGRLKTETIVGDRNCMVECYMEPMCVSVGYADAYSSCQLYTIDLAGFAYNMVTQQGTVFYKAICSDGYTYVRWLSSCIKHYDSVTQTFADAKKTCEDEGASLLEVETNDKRVYLKDTLFQIHGSGSAFQYLLGGRLVLADLWQWENAGNITLDNGAVFWDTGEPSSVAGDCMALKSVGGSDLAFVVVDCSHTHMFICAYTVL